MILFRLRRMPCRLRRDDAARFDCRFILMSPLPYMPRDFRSCRFYAPASDAFTLITLFRAAYFRRRRHVASFSPLMIDAPLR